MKKLIQIIGEMILHTFFVIAFAVLTIIPTAMFLQIFYVVMVAIWGVILGIDIVRLTLEIIDRKIKLKNK